MITDAIRSANSEQEVILLLTTYIESARASGRFHFLAENVMPMSINGTAEIRTQLESLLLELDAASRNLDDYSRDVLHEAVHIYGTGLEQLVKLHRRQQARLAA